jgi:hypothetical protein
MQLVLDFMPLYAFQQVAFYAQTSSIICHYNSIG